MFDYFKQIFLIIQLKSFFYLFTNADEFYISRYKRAIGGESLDTSNFVLSIDPDGTRFIEIPREFMNNWLDDQKMWRQWSIILAVMCFIFFVTIVFFLIYGFYTSTGLFTECTRSNNENSSNDKLILSSSSSSMTINRKDPLKPLQQTYFIHPYQISAL